MYSQGHSPSHIAHALDRSVRAVQQKYLKVVPLANGIRKKESNVDMSKDMKFKLLAAVAKRKNAFWATVAKEVGERVSGALCEAEWNDVIRNRKV
jgi:hypothetical protein